MIHRDLTPNNIFLTSDDRVKIGDFGLALQKRQLVSAIRHNSLIAVSPENQQLGTDAMTPSTGGYDENVVGTSFYISPEILAGSSYDQKTDMYSLGVVLLEMFYYFETGSERCNVLSRIQACTSPNCSDILPPSFIQNKSTENAAKLVIFLTSKKPAERPLAQDLLRSGKIS